jgi:hypothetical protein
VRGISYPVGKEGHRSELSRESRIAEVIEPVVTEPDLTDVASTSRAALSHVAAPEITAAGEPIVSPSQIARAAFAPALHVAGDPVFRSEVTVNDVEHALRQLGIPNRMNPIGEVSEEQQETQERTLAWTQSGGQPLANFDAGEAYRYEDDNEVE